jgi:hypothetical protein
MSQPTDRRQFAPATERNRDPILAVLESVLPAEGTVLEVASGTGQHAAYFAPRLMPRHWLPSDPNPIARDSIRGWRAAAAIASLHEPLELDVSQPNWSDRVQQWQNQTEPAVPPIAAIVNINMIHISPWAASEGLFAGAQTLLSAGQVLYLYGPFRRDGKHTAPSNEAFDASLRSQNPAWGVRDLGSVGDLAAQHQFQLSQIVEMPANNLSVVFVRQ